MAQRASSRLRALLNSGRFLGMPSAYDPLGARLIQATGFKAVYNGGFVTGGMTCISEPLMTMNEQLQVAANVANAVSIPVFTDAGGGYGEPLHCMRTVREFARHGVAAIHIEDQWYPKRAHYHTYIEHNIPTKDFIDKIRYACIARDEVDPDFVVCARSDACRIQGLPEAIRRINKAADVGADIGMIFPRNHAETVKAPKQAKLPLVYVQSRGNRDGRPLYSWRQLEDMGYRWCIDAIWAIGITYHFLSRALEELKGTGDYTGMTPEEFVAARHNVEKLIGLEDYYRIEAETVEKETYAAMRRGKGAHGATPATGPKTRRAVAKKK